MISLPKIPIPLTSKGSAGTLQGIIRIGAFPSEKLRTTNVIGDCLLSALTNAALTVVVL